MKQLIRIIACICIFSVTSFATTSKFEKTKLSKQISTFTKQIKERSSIKLRKKVLVDVTCASGDVTQDGTIVGEYLYCCYSNGDCILNIVYC